MIDSLVDFIRANSFLSSWKKKFPFRKTKRLIHFELVQLVCKVKFGVVCSAKVIEIMIDFLIFRATEP